MKFSVVAVASVLASLVYSQSISQETAQLPSCSLSCLSDAIVNNDCSLTDYACQCGAHRSAISLAATPCIVSSCNVTQALNVQKIVQEICSLQSALNSASTSGGSRATTNGASVTTSTASGIGSSMGSSIYGASTTAPSPTSSSSSPTQASQAAGSRLEAAGAMAGAAIIVAFAL